MVRQAIVRVDADGNAKVHVGKQFAGQTVWITLEILSATIETNPSPVRPEPKQLSPDQWQALFDDIANGREDESPGTP